VVVTDPSQASPFGAGDIGYNTAGVFMSPPSLSFPFLPHPEPMHMVWVGTTPGQGGFVNQDQFTDTFSHELAERMSGSTSLNAPSLPFKAGGHQIGDNEPNNPKGNYVYRLGGDLVQAYWSDSDKAYVVPDGSDPVNLIVNPIWSQGNSTASGNTFTGNFSLSVKGDQFGADVNDHVRIDLTPGGGVRVEQDDITQPRNFTAFSEVTFQFDPGAVRTVNIDTVSGQNTVQVAAVPAGVTVNIDSSGNSNDLISVRDDNGSIQGIGGWSTSPTTAARPSCSSTPPRTPPWTLPSPTTRSPWPAARAASPPRSTTRGPSWSAPGTKAGWKTLPNTASPN
jgi:hypothetical protein